MKNLARAWMATSFLLALVAASAPSVLPAAVLLVAAPFAAIVVLKALSRLCDALIALCRFVEWGLFAFLAYRHCVQSWNVAWNLHQKNNLYASELYDLGDKTMRGLVRPRWLVATGRATPEQYRAYVESAR